MSRRERVGDEKVNNIVFLGRVEEGLLEGSRAFVECSELCLVGITIKIDFILNFPSHLFKWYLWFGIVVVSWRLPTEVCETLWIVRDFNLFLQPSALGGGGDKETFWERSYFCGCVSERKKWKYLLLEGLLLQCSPHTVWSGGCKEAVGELCHRLNILFVPGIRYCNLYVLVAWLSHLIVWWGDGEAK